MMRRFATRVLLTLVLLCMPAWAGAQQAAIPRFDSPVVDTTGTLDAATRQQIEQQSLALQQRKGSQLQVLVIPTTATRNHRGVRGARLRVVQARPPGRG